MPESSYWEIAPSVGQDASVRVRAIIGFFFKYFFILLAGALLGVLMGLAAQAIISKKYQASGKFIVNELVYAHGMANIDAETERQLAETLIESISSQEMRGAIENRLHLKPKQVMFSGLDKPLLLRGSVPRANITITAVKNSRIGVITANSQSPKFAIAVVNAILEEIQLYNFIGGHIKDIDVALAVEKNKVDALSKQMIAVSSYRIKLENENAELGKYREKNLPIESYPSFASDPTLNNLKTQYFLVNSEYDAIASSSTRGERLREKAAELASIRLQIQRYCSGLVEALRSQLLITSTEEKGLSTNMEEAKNSIDRLAQENAVLSQSLSDPKLRRKFAKKKIAGAAGPTGPANVISVVDQAMLLTKPVWPKLWLNLILGTILGTGLSLAFCVLRNLLDNRVSNGQQIESATGLPCLACICKRPYSLEYSGEKLPIFKHRQYSIGLEFLRSYVLSGSKRVIGMTPASSKVDASQLICDLAVLLAQAGKRTLVVDLYLKHSHIADLLSIPVNKGFGSWKKSKSSLNSHICLSATGNLGILCAESFSQDLENFLSATSLASALQDLSDQWDVVLINSPCILDDWSLTVALPPQAPLLICAKYKKNRVEEISRVKQYAKAPRWDVQGVILLNIPKRIRMFFPQNT